MFVFFPNPSVRLESERLYLEFVDILAMSLAPRKHLPGSLKHLYLKERFQELYST